MDLTSLKFIIPVFASIYVYYLLNPKYRIGFLTVLSCLFIASISYYLIGHVVLFSLLNYFIGLKIAEGKYKITFYRLGIILNISQLVILKYASFTIDPFFYLIDSSIQVSKLAEIIIPLGISYFTLQGIGYLINVKMGWETPEKRFLDFLLYIIFFPKFLSGPIERSNHFLPQLKKQQRFNEKQINEGLRIALIGFYKKIVIANQLAPYVLEQFSDIHMPGGFSFWIVFILLPIYLYFDFSGYTDIAIGIAKTFGIELLPNFNLPFFSQNVTTFWKRFHISLASWFNDYIFRLTVFKRRKWGINASIYAVFITWTLFGIWHGAGWNFMVLGLLQAIVIVYEFLSKKFRYQAFSKLPISINIWAGRIFTYLFYCLSLVLFFSPDLKTAFVIILKLLRINDPVQVVPISTIPVSLIVSLPVFLLLELIQNDYQNIFLKISSYWNGTRRKNIIFRWVVFWILISVMLSIGNQVETFVYVRF